MFIVLCFWRFSDFSISIADTYVYAPSYDIPAAFAFLSLTPTLVMFVVKVETAFFEKYRSLFYLINHNASYNDIAYSKEEVLNVTTKEVQYMMEIQLFFSIIFIVLGSIFLPNIGFTSQMIALYVILVMGYYCVVTSFVIMTVMLYYDHEMGALTLAGFLFFSVAILTRISIILGESYYGIGFFLGGFLTLVLGFVLLNRYLSDLEYRVFCDQVVWVEKEDGPIRRAVKRYKEEHSRMKANRLGIPIIFLICLGSVLLLSVEIQEKYVVEPNEPLEETIEYHPPELLLNEDKSVYEQDPDDHVDIFEVSVYPPDDVYYDLDYINTNINYIAGSYSEDTLDPQARITLQIDGINYEGTLELRGQSSRLLDQKSYKIKLFDNVDAFKGMRVLNLNKHYKDNFRIRNKLAYDVLEEMDNLIGLRTRFVRLYITEGGKRSDFGLYTLVEQPNKAFLSSHGLDTDGQLYKAEFFEFLRYDGVLEASSSPLYSEENFNQHLEVRENPNHDKLVYLLESINDPKQY